MTQELLLYLRHALVERHVTLLNTRMPFTRIVLGQKVLLAEEEV